MNPGEDEDLWVRSEVMPDGTYGVGISVERDHAFALNRDQAIAYATACIARATEADHDTAVMRLLVTKLGIPPKSAAEFIKSDLRPDRPDEHKATEPLRFSVAIGRARHPRPDAGTYIPLLMMQHANGEDAGQLTPADLRDHATAVLSVIAAADLDANLHRCLVSTLGLDDGRAKAVVGSLAEHMPGADVPRRTPAGDAPA